LLRTDERKERVPSKKNKVFIVKRRSIGAKERKGVCFHSIALPRQSGKRKILKKKKYPIAKRSERGYFKARKRRNHYFIRSSKKSNGFVIFNREPQFPLRV